MRGLGYLQDLEKEEGEPPDWDFAKLATRLKVTAPTAHSLRELVLSVLDQGGLGACVLNGSLQAIRMRHVAQGVKAPTLGSRLMGYYLARAVDHNTAVDSGTYPRTAFEIFNKFGFCPEELWPYSDQNDSSAKDPFKLMPSTAAFEAAFDQKSPTIYRRITTIGNQRLADVKTAIAGGFPVVFGCNVSNAFCRGDFNKNEPLKAPTSDIAGGHCMLWEGYSGDIFETLNSWSEDFGNKGRVLFSPEYVQTCTDLWVVEHAPVEGEV